MSEALHRAELAAIEEQLRHASGAARMTLHRDAAYVALDLGHSALAMTHAVQCLDAARGLGDPRLEAKAHVTAALVMADAYDDQGAETHFSRAEALARACGDARGVALVAVNASHFELERNDSAAAAARLQALLDSDYAPGLLIADVRVGHELHQSFHINYVKGAALALRGEVPADLRARLEAQLPVSAAFLQTLHQEEGLDTARWGPDILDALTAYALWQGRPDEALALADEEVALSRVGGTSLQLGRALLERAGVHAERGEWTQVILDAQEAAPLFEQAGRDLLSVQAWQAVADARAQQGHYREAFEVQRQLTARTQALHRAFFQQGAQLRQIERQAQEAEVRARALAEAALRDPLTGVPNRTHAMNRLQEVWAQAQQGQPNSVALLDIDHFKSVNDRFGHAVGDEVLTRVAQGLSEAVRGTGCLTRFGGEEFLLILPDLSPQDARRVCERLRQTLRELSWADLAPGLAVTGSFGVAAVRRGLPVKDTLQAADGALYAAKAAGRDTVRVELRPAGIGESD
ncbi:GGDEF domain-containing protein [Deinococcus aquaedulcis]|uniref:GGDEF domain-containing protein n=1 Tax=Deinococcus aquaedulcis TaxID=2840455 RepID=UPI001C836F1F|nr:GGDEF domain-containing protein [Deinococcus aquaedulcis]